MKEPAGGWSSARLLELLNGNIWTIERFGFDPNGRRLATIRIGGVDVGDILVAERLALVQARWGASITRPDGFLFVRHSILLSDI
ncbi:MAG: hypothetical protein AB7O56_07945 [Bauldia sp.]